MTIPQGDNRGPQSISERRKVTYAGDSPTSGEQPSKTASAKLSGDNDSNSSSDSVNDKEYTGEASQEFNGAFLLIQGKSEDKNFRGFNQCLSTTEPLEVNVTVLSHRDSKKASLPLLNLLKGDGASASSDRSRKLSLNLTKTSQKAYPENRLLERTRRFSQPQKSLYQRVPQEDPSPLSPVFTLQLGQINQASKHQQSGSKHSAEVHASFHEQVENKGSKFTQQTSTIESSNTKRVLFGKQRVLNRTDSCRSLDDLAFLERGDGSDQTKTFSSSRSASSEHLPTFRRKLVGSSGGSGGNYPRQQHREDHPSSTSPSHCCLVSVSRVPMAAATSHLTLDSDYQTVRLAVLGAPGVGKSSIVRQFVMQQFVEEYVPTEQRQVFCPAVIINEHLYEVRIIDCPYIPYFPVNSLYEWTDFRGYGLRNATAYVLVYDITSEESFEYIKSLRLQILESRNKHDVPIFVVGNKHDLAEERGVPRREVREIANLVKKQWKCGYIECSAKYNWHIMLLFKELMKTVDYIDYGHKPTSMRVQDALRRNRCLIL